MSGGSYDYLFTKDAYDDHNLGLFNHEQQIEAMAIRLAGLRDAEDAARETEELLLIMRQARVRIQARADRLTHVWHAVEWWDSGDSGEDGVRKALADYRKDKEAK